MCMYRIKKRFLFYNKQNSLNKIYNIYLYKLVYDFLFILFNSVLLTLELVLELKLPYSFSGKISLEAYIIIEFLEESTDWLKEPTGDLEEII